MSSLRKTVCSNVLAFGVAQAAPPPFAPPTAIRYAITDLGTVEGTGSSFPTAINNKGEVVGMNEFASEEYNHAFLYSGGQMRDIAGGSLGFYPSEALGINDLSEVVGYAANEDIISLQGFLYKNGQMLPLWPLGVAEAAAINNFGQIAGVGGILAPVTAERDSGIVFRYMQGHVLFQATLGNPESPSAINNRGQVVGSGLPVQTGIPTYEYTEHAFLYNDGNVQDLGTLGAITNVSYATALNDNGQVVGDVEIAPNNVGGQTLYHAFVYSGGKMRDLGTLGGSYSYALGINNLGVIVGSSYHAGSSPANFEENDPLGVNTRAFVYIAGQMYDLNKLLVANPAGWTLLEAVGINDFGQIAVAGISSDGQTVHALVLKPVKVRGFELLK